MGQGKFDIEKGKASVIRIGALSKIATQHAEIRTDCVDSESDMLTVTGHTLRSPEIRSDEESGGIDEMCCWMGLSSAMN